MKGYVCIVAIGTSMCTKYQSIVKKQHVIPSNFKNFLLNIETPSKIQIAIFHNFLLFLNYVF